MKINEGLSAFGKALRKIRIDHDLTLEKLAGKLGVSAAFISALERGKPVPPDFITEVARAVPLGETDIDVLQEAAARQLKEVTLPMAGRSDQAKVAALSFARRFEALSDTQLAELLNSINKR